MLIPAAFLFFLSGCAALVYQVTWQRLLVIFSGADVYSATVVVAVFMAGLGCGTLIGGYLADRPAPVRCLGRVFPYAIRFGDALVGANEPIEIDQDAIAARLKDPAVTMYYRQAGIDIAALVGARLIDPGRFAPSAEERARITDINTDLFPRDEFARP